MDNTSRKRASRSYRIRLTERGLARFQVLGRDTDRALIRSLARRLSEEGPDAARLRQNVNQVVTECPPEAASPRKGDILAALRRSPLVGADLDLTRLHVTERDVDL